MIDNQKFTTHHNILSRISMKYKSKEFNPDDVMEWCQMVETEYICDIDTMIKFLNVKLPVVGGKAMLPCNVYRVVNVFTDPNVRHSTIQNYNNGAYLFFNSNFKGDFVYINYIGTNIDETGIPLIVKGHEQACETFVKMSAFEEDAVTGKFPAQIWSMWNQQFSGQCEAAKSDFRHYQDIKLEKMDMIKMNFIPRVGNKPLLHKF